MADSGNGNKEDIVLMESEDARSELAQILATKRAGPDGNVVRIENTVSIGFSMLK